MHFSPKPYFQLISHSREWAWELWHTSLVAPGMWDLPRPGIKLVSPELAAGLSITGLLEKSSVTFLHCSFGNQDVSALGFSGQVVHGSEAC